MSALEARVVRIAGWWLLALLAFAVAGYALGLLVMPGWRPGFARDLLAGQPLTAWAHFAGGGIALAVGALQANRWVRTHHRAFHRWLGRLYVIAVLAGGTAALALALNSPMGFPAQSGFALLAVLWIGSTFMAWRYARVQHFDRHREWMLRSYALTFAAVTLRLYLPLSQVAGVPFPTAYAAIAWLCWVPNLVLIEWLVLSRHTPRAMPA